MDYIITKTQLEKLLDNPKLSTKCSGELFKKLNKRTTLNFFRSAIEKMLEPHLQNWKGDRKKYEENLTLIGKTPEQINDILNMKFVYDKDGNWSRVNKLNTNYSDIAVLVIDIFTNEGRNLCEILNNLEKGNTSDLTSLATAIKNNSEKYFKEYLESDDGKYTENNKKNTDIGDKDEQEVIEFLKDTYNWTLIYQSVEGSPIDTKLGIDIIMKSDKGIIAKIQVKGVGTIKVVKETPCEQGGTKFEHKKRPGGFSVYSYNGVHIRPQDINLVAYVDKKGSILVVRKFSPVTIIDNKCIDKPTRQQFPSNPKGSFYVDHESVVFYKK